MAAFVELIKFKNMEDLDATIDSSSKKDQTNGSISDLFGTLQQRRTGEEGLVTSRQVSAAPDPAGDIAAGPARRFADPHEPAPAPAALRSDETPLAAVGEDRR